MNITVERVQKNIDWKQAEIYLSSPDLSFVINSVPSVPSTQLLAKDAARGGAQGGSVYVTDFQSSGRGRRDRQWQSLPGQDLTFSLLLRPDMPTSYAPMLNIAASTAVCRALKNLSPTLEERTAIKWPNDLLVGGRKICGIICEGSGSAEKLDYAILGIGINVNGRESGLPETGSPDRPNPTSLRAELGREINLPVLLAAVLNELDRTCPLVVCEAGRAELISVYRPLCCTLGEAVRIITDGGEQTGRAVDITPSGALVIDAEGVRTTFDVGDVVHARAVSHSAQ